MESSQKQKQQLEVYHNDVESTLIEYILNDSLLSQKQKGQLVAYISDKN